jgi:hypothetical protein
VVVGPNSDDWIESLELCIFCGNTSEVDDDLGEFLGAGGSGCLFLPFLFLPALLVLLFLDFPAHSSDINRKYHFSMYVIHLPPPDSTVSEHAGIEPTTAATLALTARRLISSTARLDLIHWLRLTGNTVPVPGTLEPSISNPVSLNPDPGFAESQIRT